MPTYFTENFTDFSDFKEKCIKSFELYDQREYLEEALAKARGELCYLIHLDSIDHDKEFYLSNATKEYQDTKSRLALLELKYRCALEEALAWNGPEKIKNFMISQLEISLEHDIYDIPAVPQYNYEKQLEQALERYIYSFEAYNKHCAALEANRELLNEARIAR